MSRGLGRVEQELLHEIEINPQERTVVAPFGTDPAKAEARRRAAREELKAHESASGTRPYHRSELRVTIQRVSGDPMAADLLLSELEASLGDSWRLDVLGERNGTAQIRVVLDGE